MRTIMAIVILIAISGLAIAQGDPNAQPGAVMASTASGDDVNLFPGTAIYIKGHSLVPSTTFEWKIFDKEVTCPPGIVNPDPKVGCAIELAHGSGGSTNTVGEIPPYPTGWSIPDGVEAGHDYKLWVKLGPTSDPHYAEFYVKIDSFDPIPEIATVGLVTAGLFGLVMLRRYKK